VAEKLGTGTRSHSIMDPRVNVRGSVGEADFSQFGIFYQRVEIGAISVDNLVLNQDFRAVLAQIPAPGGELNFVVDYNRCGCLRLWNSYDGGIPA